jgi:hypothetical protein
MKECAMILNMRISRKFFTLALFLGTLTAVGAGAQKLQGTWGGERVIMKAGETGAEVEFECAHGRIAQAILPDDRGNFDLPGSLTPEGHGPTRDGAESANPARYKGHVDDKTMTLTIIVGDEKLGPYSLTRDNEPILRKCR